MASAAAALKAESAAAPLAGLIFIPSGDGSVGVSAGFCVTVTVTVTVTSLIAAGASDGGGV